MDKNDDKENSLSGLSLESFEKLSDEAKLQGFKLLSERDRWKVFLFGCKELRYKLFDLLSEDDKPCYLAVYFSEDEIIKDNLLQKILPVYMIFVFGYLKSDLAKFKCFSLLPEASRLEAFNSFHSDEFKSMVFYLLPEADRLEAFEKFESDEFRSMVFGLLPEAAILEAFDMFQSDEYRLEAFEKFESDEFRSMVFVLLPKADRLEAFEKFVLLPKADRLEAFEKFESDEFRSMVFVSLPKADRLEAFEKFESDEFRSMVFVLLPKADRLGAFDMFQSDAFRSTVFGLLPEGDRLEAFGKFESDEAKYGCFEFLPIDSKEKCFDVFDLKQKILIYKKKLNFDERYILFSNITQELEDLANDGEINDVEIDTIVRTLLNHLSFEDCLKRFEQFCGLSFGRFDINYCNLFLKNLDSHRKFYCFSRGLPEEKKLEVFCQLAKPDRLILLPNLSENERFKAFEEVILPEERLFYFALLNLKDDKMSEAFKLILEKDRDLALKTLSYEKDELRKKLSDTLNPLSMLKVKKMLGNENKVPECENNNKTDISRLGEIY